MTNVVKKIVIGSGIIALLGSSGSAFAVPDILNEYKTKARFNLFMCKTAFEGEQARNNLGLETQEEDTLKHCVDSSYGELTPIFKQALEALETTDAKKALKRYHAYYLTVMKGIEPLSGERVYQYEERQNGYTQQLSEKWSALEVELL